MAQAVHPQERLLSAQESLQGVARGPRTAANQKEPDG